MYSTLLARVLPKADYDWFVYDGKKPVGLDFRGKEVIVDKGTRFGVRKSTSGKNIRLVLGDDVNKVFTITLDVAKRLAQNIRGE